MRQLITSRYERGDTLTEVMFATAVAALVIVLAMTAMNRSFTQTQMSVETTFVRQSIDAESEFLHYARDQYNIQPNGAAGALWRSIVAQADANTDGASTFGTCYDATSGSNGGLPSDSFFISDDLSTPALVKINAVNAADFSPDPFATIGRGIWIEAVKGGNPSKSLKYLDLHIRACWEPPYSGPNATLGTIVRLYYAE